MFEYFKRVLIILLILIIIYVAYVPINLSGDNFSATSLSSEEEVNFMNALAIFRGEGLYKGFSIVYPPGRLLVQSLMFHILGPSIPTTRLYFPLTALFFPTVFFFLSYIFFTKFATRFKSVFLAIIATFIYSSFIRFAQEAQIFSALFFLILFEDYKMPKVRHFLLGFFLGLVFLFRIDAGILLLLSLVICEFKKIKKLKLLQTSLLGFLTVWLPTLIYIFFAGSLGNFLYDTLYLGLIVQPKMMSLSIPPHLEKLFLMLLILLFSSSLALFIDSKKKSSLKIFAVFSVLSFVAGLGRSDEGHLWYGAVWLPINVSYLILRLSEIKNLFKNIKPLLIFFYSLCFYFLGFFLIKFKIPSFFIITTLTVFILLKKLKKDQAPNILLAGLLTSLFVFHSISFLKLRYSPPLLRIPGKLSFSAAYFRPDENEIAGLRFDKEILKTLKRARQKMDNQTLYLFIYPKNVIYYEFFKLKNPTRHYYHVGETTKRLQEEIISDLKLRGTTNFLIFPDEVTFHGRVWQWILQNTYIESTFNLKGVKMELRKIKKTK